MTLHDDKTGRHWPARSFEVARRLASILGLTDWTWCPVTAPAPASIRETTNAIRERGMRHGR